MAYAQVGQQYRKVDGTRSVWQVTAVEADLNGIRHCHIVDIRDRTSTKAISESTLTKRRFFRLVAEHAASHEYVE